MATPVRKPAAQPAVGAAEQFGGVGHRRCGDDDERYWDDGEQQQVGSVADVVR
jgi:hypothetical protein